MSSVRSYSRFGGIGRAMSHENFRLYWYGMSAVTVCFWAYRVALGWLVWELTHSPTWLGLIAFAEMVPMTLLAPVAGVLVDQRGSLHIARIAQTGWGVVIILLASLTSAGLATKEVLLAFAVVQGIVASFSNPAQLALVARIVPRTDLSPAIAMQSGTVQAGRFIGPAIAGPILLFSGPALIFWLVSAGFLFFVMMLFRISTIETELSNRQSKGIVANFLEGIRYSFSHLGIRNMILFSAIMSLLLRPLAELMPGISDNVFGRGPEGLAWLLAAFGLGSLLSSVYLALRGQNKGLARIYLFYFAIGSITLVIFSIISIFWVALLLVTIFGFSTNTVSVAGQTMVQHMVSEHMRARTMSLLGLTFRAVPAAGALILGFAQSSLGMTGPLIAAGLLGLMTWAALVAVMRGGALARQLEVPIA